MTPLRLLKPDGTPKLTKADHELLHQARRFAPNAATCVGKLHDGVLADDPNAVRFAVLQLRSISMFLAEFLEGRE